MILNIFCHKNTKIDCFTQPIYSDVDPDKFVTNELRSLKLADLSAIVPYKNLELWFLGIFDDSNGDFILVDEDGNKLARKLVDVGNLVIERIAEEKGVKKDELESIPIER